MSDVSLKAILALDEKTRRHKPAGHNLSAEKAEERAAHLRAKGVSVTVLDQPSRHSGHGYKNCNPCENAALNLAPEPPQEPAQETTENVPEGDDEEA